MASASTLRPPESWASPLTVDQLPIGGPQLELEAVKCDQLWLGEDMLGELKE